MYLFLYYYLPFMANKNSHSNVLCMFDDGLQRTTTSTCLVQVVDVNYRYSPPAPAIAAVTAACNARLPASSPVTYRRCLGGALPSPAGGDLFGHVLRRSTSTSAATLCTNCATSTGIRAGTTTNGVSRPSSRAVSMVTASSPKPKMAAYQ